MFGIISTYHNVLNNGIFYPEILKDNKYLYIKPKDSLDRYFKAWKNYVKQSF